MKIIDRKFLGVETNACHASTIAFYKDKPVYAWFGGTREGATDVAIYVQYDDKVVHIRNNNLVPMWNPILFPYKNQLFLFLKAGRFCDCWQTFIYNISNIWDDDFDINKIVPRLLPAGLNGPTKTKPIVINGFVYCGSSVETAYDWSGCIEIYEVKKGFFKLVHRTDPIAINKVIYDSNVFGSTIKKTSLGIIQPSIWLEKGKHHSIFHAFFRSSKGLGKIYHSSYEMYKDPDAMKHDFVKKLHMEVPQPTKFDNPNSGIDTVYFDKRLFLVYNPSTESRMPLIVQELDSNFEVKDEIVVTEKITLADNTNSLELSYPYMVEHDGNLHLTYTYGRSKIENVTIEV